MNRLTYVLVMLLIAAPAVAQQTTLGAGLQPEGLPTVFVQDDRGIETGGKLLRLDQQLVMVLVDGQERTFELSSVRKIQKKGDRLRNGAIIGAIFGAIMGGMIVSECPGPDIHCAAGARMAIALTSTAAYAAIGTGIDAAIPGRTTLYQRPVSTSAARASRPTAAARLTVSW
ncbi:MAG: hypothetical protein ACJ731_06395 [Vicinamibacterales bacterium]